MSMIRTFLAVEVSRDVRRRAAKLVEQLSQSGANIKWVSHDNVHVTLGFLGDIDERQIPELCHTAKIAIEGFEAFEINCETVGAFPNTSNPRTIWMGVQDGAETLCRLQSALADALAADGYPQETRKYHPHLTLGRTRRGSRLRELVELLRERESFVAGTARIAEVVVFASRLEPAGPIYHTLSRIPLA